MGNVDQGFCCDHAAELSLFHSNRKTIISPKKEDILRNLKTRNDRIFSKDDISIIDQLEIRPETQRQERLSMKVRRSKEKENDMLDQRQTAVSFNPDKQKSFLAERERKWYENRLRELQEQKEREMQRVRMKLQSEYKARPSLKHRKSKKEEPQKKYDFQFIVNYRN